jgi:arginyl-tRNA synthetase
MITRISEEIKELLTLVGVTTAVDFTTPPKVEMGDFAFPCFGLGKLAQKNPVEVAKELAEKLNNKVKERHSDYIVGRAQAFGPYVNFFLRPARLAEFFVSAIGKQAESFGTNGRDKGQKIVIEYPSNNTHKEFHIGHFRNVCIGNTLVALYRAAGATVYPINYLNDFGSHVAKCLWGLQKFHAGEKPPANKQRWLGEIYAEASRYIVEHSEVQEEVAKLQQQIEAKDKSIWALFSETREWSIEKFNELFKELGVEHAAVFYEKDLKADGQKTINDLLRQGIATIGEGGAIIVDLNQYKLDVAMLRKSNGSGLYLTSDLPLAEVKFKKYKADESIVITGQEQVFYFKQLYKILSLIGFNKKLTHISYGLVNLPEGKMSSRTGNVVIYEDLRDQVYAKLLEETKTRHADWKIKQVEQTAWLLTQAALKFDMQKHEAVKNITFDIKEATAVEGFTGPYVLYAVARIASLYKKAKIEKIKPANSFKELSTIEEKQLALFLGEFPEVVEKALAQYNPSVIARYTFDLAQAFNNFYSKHSVVEAESKELAGERLALCLAVQQVLKNALKLLTIETVEEM